MLLANKASLYGGSSSASITIEFIDGFVLFEGVKIGATNQRTAEKQDFHGATTRATIRNGIARGVATSRATYMDFDPIECNYIIRHRLSRIFRPNIKSLA